MIPSLPKKKYDALVEMIGYPMIAYILLCVGVGGFTVSTLYNRQQTIAALVALVLLIAVFAFYGLRWFKGGVLKGSEEKTDAWPPIVNMCPDFMVTYKNTDGNTYCFDINNTYNAKTYSGSSTANGFTGITISGVTNAQGYMIRNAATTGDNAPRAKDAQRLKEDTSTPYKFPLASTLKNDAQAIVGNTRPSGKWLRWEGVWDGRSLTPDNAPLVL